VTNRFADAEHDEWPEESRDRSIWRSLKALTAADPLAAQKNKDGLIDALYIFDIEMPDAVSEFIFWYCGDLINHESGKSICARSAQSERETTVPQLDRLS
jgi:hypothetical protein